MTRATGEASRASGSTVREKETMRKKTSPASRGADLCSLGKDSSPGADLRLPRPQGCRSVPEHVVSRAETTLVAVEAVPARELVVPRLPDLGIGRLGRFRISEQPVDLRRRGAT
jgi:hypothetical protein